MKPKLKAMTTEQMQTNVVCTCRFTEYFRINYQENINNVFSLVLFSAPNRG